MKYLEAPKQPVTAYKKKKIVILTLLQFSLLGLANAYDRLVICNGCRPKWLTDILPKKLDAILAPFFDLIFKKACGNHDIVYFVGGTESDRKRGDKYFRYEMNQALKLVTWDAIPYKKLEKTKWYQIKLKNIGRGLYNILPAIGNGGKATGNFFKRQYYKIKVFEYYLLVRKAGKDSFNFKAPITSIKEFPSYLPLNDVIGNNNKTFVYDDRIHLESEHSKRML